MKLHLKFVWLAVMIIASSICFYMFGTRTKGKLTYADSVKNLLMINSNYLVPLMRRYNSVMSYSITLDGLVKPSDLEHEKYVVPNIVHYVWLGAGRKLRFHEYLSVLSSYKFIKPEKIYFHLDHEPVGKYWSMIKQKVKCLILNYTEAPKEIFGIRMKFPTHQSDKVRIQTLIKHGGIYLDTDVLVLKSFDPLRKFNYTMGIEYHGDPGRLNSGVIVSRKNATFLHIWYNTYRNFSTYEGDFHACIIPYYLQYQYPSLIHVEETSLNYPSGPHSHLIYKTNYNFSKNYAMHLWFRFYEREHDPEEVKFLNTTYGQMARLILYNTTSLIPSAYF